MKMDHIKIVCVAQDNDQLRTEEIPCSMEVFVNILKQVSCDRISGCRSQFKPTHS
jgi:hypothetical protein